MSNLKIEKVDKNTENVSVLLYFVYELPVFNLGFLIYFIFLAAYLEFVFRGI